MKRVKSVSLRYRDRSQPYSPCTACGYHAVRFGRCTRCRVRPPGATGGDAGECLRDHPARAARIEALAILAARGLPLFSGPRSG